MHELIIGRYTEIQTKHTADFEMDAVKHGGILQANKPGSENWLGTSPLMSSSNEIMRRRCGSSLPVQWLLWIWLIFYLAGSAAVQAIVGTIKTLKGTANVQRSGRSIVGIPAMPILVGDKLETSGQSSVTIQLIDGSQLILADATSA